MQENKRKFHNKKLEHAAKNKALSEINLVYTFSLLNSIRGKHALITRVKNFSLLRLAINRIILIPNILNSNFRLML